MINLHFVVFPSTTSGFYATTPPAVNGQADEGADVTLINGIQSDKAIAKKTFRYLSNPEIEKIYPLEVLSRCELHRPIIV